MHSFFKEIITWYNILSTHKLFTVHFYVVLIDSTTQLQIVAVFLVEIKLLNLTTYMQAAFTQTLYPSPSLSRCNSKLCDRMGRI